MPLILLSSCLINAGFLPLALSFPLFAPFTNMDNSVTPIRPSPRNHQPQPALGKKMILPASWPLPPLFSVSNHTETQPLLFDSQESVIPDQIGTKRRHSVLNQTLSAAKIVLPSLSRRCRHIEGGFSYI